MSHFFLKAFIHAFIEIEPNNQQKLSEKGKKKKQPKTSYLWILAVNQVLNI